MIDFRKIVAQEQALAGMAEILADFRRCLVAAGFDRNESLYLVGLYMQTAIGGAMTKDKTEGESADEE